MTNSSRPPLPPLHTQLDLEHAWSLLMGDLGFAAPQVWVMLIDASRPVHLMKLEQVPLRPCDDDRERLGEMAADLLAQMPGVELAFLYARPGGAMRTPADLGWARALADVSPEWAVHLANDVELRVASPDDLGATG